MNKLFISLLMTGATAGLSGTAVAQRNVSLGLKAGASLSNLVGKDAKPYQDIVGFQAGGFANIGFTRLFAFQPEIIYSRKGAKLETPDLTTRLDYVDVPMAFHANAGGLFFEAGPQVGFLISAKDKLGSATTDVKDFYNTVDFGYLFGLGYQRKAGPGIGLRYNGGFTNVREALTVGSTKFQEQRRNSVFQLYATFSFQGR
ncbi:porin family protein [Hymenobacter psychrophilus]|uniref:Outer membrane protein beta-barrel domain-containing protein n=1 Tax=Hymenobacter psychrophilus TaxID=651662 RepID=A0A1H3NQ53_9BACT|nr:porin family protein [Hymenobacter psychrophilus]SDY90299.1 Outer membrane protein beta-barrel domain-containing protein [Hymenobacter psychrophilus]